MGRAEGEGSTSVEMKDICWFTKYVSRVFVITYLNSNIHGMFEGFDCANSKLLEGLLISLKDATSFSLPSDTPRISSV